MSQPKGHFESYPASYYTGDMDADRGRSHWLAHIFLHWPNF